MNIVGLVIVSVGLFFLAVTSIGLIRLPDFFARVHAVSKAETLGIALVLLGLIVHEGLSLVSLKLALIGIFVAIANPVSAHLLTRAAVRTGILPNIPMLAATLPSSGGAPTLPIDPNAPATDDDTERTK